MSEEIFDVFNLSDYTFLELKRGTVTGNVIVSQVPAEGVFKLRSVMTTTNNQQMKQSDMQARAATLHIRPTESFVTTGLVGHGIRCQGKDYEIIGCTGGDDFDSGERSHYTLTLQETDFADFVEES